MNSLTNNFTREDLEKVALLSRLSLTEEEKEKFTHEIADILGFVSQVSSAVEVNAVAETSGGEHYGDQFLNSFNRDTMRSDIAREEAGHYTDALLANAPDRLGDYVKVSQVLAKHKK